MKRTNPAIAALMALAITAPAPLPTIRAVSLKKAPKIGYRSAAQQAKRSRKGR